MTENQNAKKSKYTFTLTDVNMAYKTFLTS